MTPKVTVLMPVYNCEAYVAEAVSSILHQTFTDFEFLIFDDASTDNTLKIVKSFRDDRLKIIEKTNNTGYTESLNMGLKIAKGKYIARMDGDDISLPKRFEKQVFFMDHNPEIVACGTAYKYLNKDVIKRPPSDHEDIKIMLLTKTCFGHPTVFLRKEIIARNNICYNPLMEPAEDYDLWLRLVKIGKLKNLPEILLHYRFHDNQVSNTRTHAKLISYYKIKFSALNHLNLKLNKTEINLLRAILSRKKLVSKELRGYKKLRKKMIEANEDGFFKKPGFDNYIIDLEERLFKDYFLNNINYNPKSILDYIWVKSNFGYNLNFHNSLKLILKSISFYSI